MSATGVRIAGVGHYAPERVLSNADFERMFETSDEWITTRTGMKERRVAAPGEAASDMALRAARTALDRAGFPATALDCIIVATVTPDHPFPATACILGAKLGAQGVAGFDLEIACSGFIYGMTVAAGMIRSGIHRRVLVVGVERLSTFVDYADRTTAILFGDGAGAAVFEACEDDGFLAADLGGDGTTPENLWIPGGGSAEPLTPEGLAAGRDRIRMQGKEVFKFAVTKMVSSSQAVLERAGLRADEIDLMVPHQANRRIIDNAAQRLGIPMERVVSNIERYGNTSAASIPIALSEAVEANRLRDGDRVLFVGMGGGLSWGAVAWRWSA